MRTDIIHVLGAGGHGRVVIDALKVLGYSDQVIRVRDDRNELQGTTILGLRVECPIFSNQGLVGWVHAAVGAGSLRKLLLEQSGLAADRWLTVVHPHAYVADSAILGPAALVAAHAIIGPCASIEVGVIVNHGAVVDHDCRVGAFSHISPCASLGGKVSIGERVLVGAGARILPGVCIADDAIIGAGAVVLTDVPSGQTWAGVPARQAKKREE